jgi:inward rectifier potassium channel
MSTSRNNQRGNRRFVQRSQRGLKQEQPVEEPRPEAPKQGHYDPGAGLRYQVKTKRVINKDGTYNVRKQGVKFSMNDTYQVLVAMPWQKFLGLIVLYYIASNLLFATAYFLIGMDQVRGAETHGKLEEFIYAFFFSVQTFTTVGYGGMAPHGVMANLVASFEAAFGLISFAVITGVLYGRFSKPNVRILFSDHAVVAPFQGKTALMFRIANQRTNLLSEVTVRVVSVLTREVNGEFVRDYRELKLERNELMMFPMTWTIVHPIDESSPFYGKSKQELDAQEAEVLVFLKAFDDTFSQHVQTRFSYLSDEWLWGMKFTKSFRIDETGEILVDLDNLHSVEPAPLPA